MNSQINPPQSRFSGRTIAAIVLLAIGGLFALVMLAGMASTPTVYDRGVETDCSTVNPARPNSSGGIYGDGPSAQDYAKASYWAKKCEEVENTKIGTVFLLGVVAVVFLAPGVMLLLKNKKANAPYGPPAGRFSGPAGGRNPGPGQA